MSTFWGQVLTFDNVNFQDLTPLLLMMAFGCASGRYLTAEAVARPAPESGSLSQSRATCRNAAQVLAQASLREKAGLLPETPLPGIEVDQTRWFDDGRCRVRVRIRKDRLP